MRIRSLFTVAVLATLLTLSLVLSVPVGANAPVQSGTSAAGPFKIDSVHSSVVFRVKHLDVSYFYGRFNEISGQFNLDPADPSSGSIEVEIKAGSVDTNSESRDKHLRSPDFFNSKEFPTIRFKSRSIRKAGDDKLEVTGDLELHGVTRPITATIEHTGSGDRGERMGVRSGLEASFTIQRSEFGISYMPGALGEEVRVYAGLEGVKK